MALDSTLKRHDSLMPQQPGGIGKGTALALLVHVGLIIALAFGVAWRSQTPAGVSAELWAAVPQIAAPPAVEPPPKPTPTPTPPQPKPQPKAEEPPKPTQQQIDAQIAIEKEKAERKQREQREQQERERKERERKEQERLEHEKAEKAAAQKQRELEAKRQREEESRRAKLREDNLKRIIGQAGTGAPGATGTAAREAGPSASYAGRIVARVKPNIVLTDDVPGNPQADVEVRCAPDGTIVGSRLVRPSGNKAWDDAVLRALERTEVLPRDTDGRVPSPMVIAFRPRD